MPLPVGPTSRMLDFESSTSLPRGPVHLDALVVVVDGDGELLLGLVLADDVFVEESLYFLRLGQMGGGGSGLYVAAVVFEDRVADGDAFVADVGARIIAWRRDQLGDCVLRFMAERAAKCVVGTRARFHAANLFIPRTGSTIAPAS